MPVEWTTEKLAALDRSALESLRKNAVRLEQQQLVELCDDELLRRNPGGPKRRSGHAPSQTRGDVVTEYHFVCSNSRGVENREDGTFWSGTWIVAHENVRRSILHGARLALHKTRAQVSYRQGLIIDYRKTVRGVIGKHNEGIDFLVRPTPEPLPWKGSGSGEKGYLWERFSQPLSEASDGEI